MKQFVNGVIRDIEFTEDVQTEEIEQPITSEERIEALEAALLELMGVVLNG